MATTLLQAVQEMCARLKTSGSGPETVVDQPQEYDQVVRAVKQAHLEIVSSHIDWNFLWSQGTVTVQVGVNPATPAETDVGQFDVHSFYYGGQPLTEIPWQQYRRQKLSTDDQAATDAPQYFIIQPNGQVLVLPYPDNEYVIPFDYWAKARTLAGDDDELQIPDDSLEALYSRTKMIWLGDEEAPNYSIAQVDFEVAYDAMEDNHWPGKGKSTLADGQDIVVVPR